MTTDLTVDDGFDDDGSGDQTLQGDILKCVDGIWSTRESGPFPQGVKLLVVRTTTVLQHWEDHELVAEIKERPDKPLPDPDELNEKILEEKWDIGLDGKPRPPWVTQHIVYLLDQSGIAASRYTFINSTKGARIAVARLRQKVSDDRLLTGKRRLPIVELKCAPMKTPHGVKQRPDFKIVDWLDVGGNGGGDPPQQIEPPKSGGQIEKPATNKPAIAEVPFDDGIPVF
jgi:hypothetical protein